MSLDKKPEWHDAVLSMGEISGPASFICEPQLLRNIHKYAAMAASHDAAIVPNFKGHRMLPVLEHQLAAGAPSIEITTMTDIVQAYRSGLDCPFVLSWSWSRETTWQAAAALALEGATLSVDIDTVEIAEGYSAAATAAGAVLGVRIQVDAGLRGIQPTNAASLARRVASLPGLELRALTTYRGVYNRDLSFDDRPLETLGREEAELLVRLTQELTDDVGPLDVIAGSSLTASGAAAVKGVTGVGCGAYAVGDLTQSLLEQCQPAEIAMASLVTILDTDGTIGTINAGYRHLGVVRDYPPDIPGLVYAATWEGAVELTETDAVTGQIVRRHGPPLSRGQRILLIPGNARASVAQPGAVTVVDDKGCVIDAWAKQANQMDINDILI